MPKKIAPKTKKDEKKPAASSKSRPRDNDEDEESGGADAFDKTKAQGAIDPGKYDALIAELVLQDKDEKGQSVRMKYEIATDGDFRGQSVAQFYKILEADGLAGKGAAFLKKDLAILGYPDVKYADLETAFEEIVQKEMGVVITVKQNGTFTNCYLGGVSEDSEVVAEYIAQRVF